jgi:hypothetical protein
MVQRFCTSAVVTEALKLTVPADAVALQSLEQRAMSQQPRQRRRRAMKASTLQIPTTGNANDAIEKRVTSEIPVFSN